MDYVTTSKWFEENVGEFHLLFWTFKLQVINVIEPMQEIIERYIHAHERLLCNPRELRAICLQIWNKLQPNICHGLVETIRVAVVLHVKNGTNKY